MKTSKTISKLTATAICVFLILMTNLGAALGEYHHVDDPDFGGCGVCHDMLGEEPYCMNLHFVRCEIQTPESGVRTVEFLVKPDDYADGDTTYDGVCEVCHTSTYYHRNDGSGPGGSHYDGEDCTTLCHTHDNQFSAPFAQSHETHTIVNPKFGPALSCGDCHSDTLGYSYFKDGELFDSTTVCDDCHSPGGAFDGVGAYDPDDPNFETNYLNSVAYGAKYNFANGVYESDGLTLKSGKEKWCGTCHDDEPASNIPGSASVDPTVVVVDEEDAQLLCTWTYEIKSGAYDGDNYFHAAGDGSCTATWTPSIPEAGNYKVYAWWRANPNRATDAPYTINYDGGSATIDVNQRQSGSQWNLLGTYPFAAGASGSVVLSDDANGYVIADAVMFESDVGPSGTLIYAPTVTGDSTNYGFYVNGHNMNCLSCHDAGKNHIDAEHRSYVANVTDYGDSYRLTDIDGQPAMNIPRLSPPSVPLNRWSDFALCLECHNRNEVLAIGVDYTNFWNDDAAIRNSHYIHLGIRSNHFDSDWDGARDSAESCISCHNVHGTPTQVMIRHGELISTPGTTDKVPALNFAYLVGTPPGVRDTNASLGDSIGGDMGLVGPSITANGVCNACHVAISYYREARVLPKVIDPEADPYTAPPDGITEVVLSALIIDKDASLASVVVDLTEIGGLSGQDMYDDGDPNHGDAVAGDNIYSRKTTVPDTVEPGVKNLEVTATNAEGQGTNIIELNVESEGVIILDDSTDAQFVCTWGLESKPEAYNGTGHFHAAGDGSCTATWTPDIVIAGEYEVYAWWRAHSNRATDAPYTIYYDGGSATIDVNQEINGSQWNLLGTFPFAIGTSGYIQLTDDANEYVYADAIKLKNVQP